MRNATSSSSSCTSAELASQGTDGRRVETDSLSRIPPGIRTVECSLVCPSRSYLVMHASLTASASAPVRSVCLSVRSYDERKVETVRRPGRCRLSMRPATLDGRCTTHLSIGSACRQDAAITRQCGPSIVENARQGTREVPRCSRRFGRLAFVIHDCGTVSVAFRPPTLQ